MNKSLLLCCAVLICASVFSQVNVTVGPYLQSPTPNSIKIKWRTDSPAASKVMYGASPGTLTLTATDTAVTLKHTVLITGLAPYTKYYYAIYNDNSFAEGADSDHFFTTFPNSSTPGHVRAWATGDFGKGNSKEQKVRDSFPFDSTETNLWLWLGDNVYDHGLEAEYLTKVFDSVYGFRKLMRHLPFEPSPGNHDYEQVSPPTGTQPPLQHTGPYYDLVDVYKNGEAGGLATGHELFYSFDYRNVHFISFNSELGSPTNQAHDWTGAYLFGSFTSSPLSQWLNQDLTANTKPWVVVYFHQPPYTDGSHNSADAIEIYMKAIRENFCEIFEQYGVDLVVCGHSHVYERSYLVKGSYGDDADITPAMILQNWSGNEAVDSAYTKSLIGANPNQGTVYAVVGNSASSTTSPGFSHPLMYAKYGCDSCIGSFILDVEGNRLDGTYHDAYGNIRDHFTIIKTITSGIEDGEKTAAITQLNIAPNPFTHITTVSFELRNREQTNIRLLDVTGKLIEVFEGHLQSGKQSIVIDAKQLKLAAGTYTLQLRAGGGTISRTVVLQ